MTEQYQQEDINLATVGGAGATGFVFRPGEAPTLPNVFETFGAALEAAQATAGPKVIQIDDSIVKPAVIPAGDYNLSGITLIGCIENFNATGDLTEVDLDDGVTFQNLFEVSNVLDIRSNSLSPVIVTPLNPNLAILLLSRGSTIRSLSGVPLVSVPTGSFAGIVLDIGAALETDAIELDGGFANILCQDLATVQGDAVVGDTGFLFFSLLGKGLNVDPVQPGFLGSVGANSTQAGGASLLFSAGDLAAPGPSFLYPGGTNPAGGSTAAATAQGYVMTRSGFLSALSVVHQTPGAANPITYDVLVNGVPVLSLPTDASTGTSLSAGNPFIPVFSGDEITVIGDAVGAPSPTDIRVAVQVV